MRLYNAELSPLLIRRGKIYAFQVHQMQSTLSEEQTKKRLLTVRRLKNYRFNYLYRRKCRRQWNSINRDNFHHRYVEESRRLHHENECKLSSGYSNRRK